MDAEKIQSLNVLLDTLQKDRCTFYSKTFTNIRNIDDLPKLSREHLAKTKLDDRLYGEEKFLVKIVRTEGKPYLISRSPSDINRNNYCVKCERPLVAFNNVHEGIEKCLWFHQRNILPLISEHNPVITTKIAKRYRIDAILGDSETIELLTPHLHDKSLIKQIESITVVDTNFDVQFLQKHFPHSKHNFIFGIPEAGSLAVSNTFEGDAPIFTPMENAIIETGDGATVTVTTPLPTPILRLRLPISLKSVGSGKEFIVA